MKELKFPKKNKKHAPSGIEENLEGALSLSSFTNLEKLDCRGHKITSLDLSECKNLEELSCQDNQLNRLVRRDFRSENILSMVDDYGVVFIISDLNLCQPANETDKGEVYGVLPYVAPEALREKVITNLLIFILGVW
ncbi:6161_t:CDS:2 [Ambispora gerdemannii]|uniref:6161_t:CDS:1 n=1 Tax=Ambispora gerdemannii TaxID=144530 RepID=A0A9N9GVW1_9GLOM|nr:6161_t:CDS:2 [Ambispora gerdemannii]